MHITICSADPVALVANDKAALLSDAAKLYWFDWKTGVLEAIPGLPPATQAAHRDNTYVLLNRKQALVWTPGRNPRTLDQPDFVDSISGVSISPDGRYAAVAYDLDVPDGNWVGVIWAYDLQTGAIAKYPTEIPRTKLAGRNYGASFLGWSGPNVLRFVFGVHDYRVGYTWPLGDGESAMDGTQYRMADWTQVSPDGGWFQYRPIPEQTVVQSVHPDSHSLSLRLIRGGTFGSRLLLNGHPAYYTTGNASVWWELLPDGTARVWETAEALY